MTSSLNFWEGWEVGWGKGASLTEILHKSLDMRTETTEEIFVMLKQIHI